MWWELSNLVVDRVLDYFKKKFRISIHFILPGCRICRKFEKRQIADYAVCRKKSIAAKTNLKLWKIRRKLPEILFFLKRGKCWKCRFSTFFRPGNCWNIRKLFEFQWLPLTYITELLQIPKKIFWILENSATLKTDNLKKNFQILPKLPKFLKFGNSEICQKFNYLRTIKFWAFGKSVKLSCRNFWNSENSTTLEVFKNATSTESSKIRQLWKLPKYPKFLKLRAFEVSGNCWNCWNWRNFKNSATLELSKFSTFLKSRKIDISRSCWNCWKCQILDTEIFWQLRKLLSNCSSNAKKKLLNLRNLRKLLKLSKFRQILPLKTCWNWQKY